MKCVFSDVFASALVDNSWQLRHDVFSSPTSCFHTSWVALAAGLKRSRVAGLNLEDKHLVCVGSRKFIK